MEAFIIAFLENYGAESIAFCAILWLMWKTNKKCHRRLAMVEQEVKKLHAERIEDKDESVKDYIALAKNSTEVISKVTNCIETMNESLKRIESRQS